MSLPSRTSMRRDLVAFLRGKTGAEARVQDSRSMEIPAAQLKIGPHLGVYSLRTKDTPKGRGEFVRDEDLGVQGDLLADDGPQVAEALDQLQDQVRDALLSRHDSPFRTWPVKVLDVMCQQRFESPVQGSFNLVFKVQYTLFYTADVTPVAPAHADVAAESLNTGHVTETTVDLAP